MKYAAVLALALAVVCAGCSRTETPEPEPPTALRDYVQRPLDKAESVNDTIMQNHEERQRRLEEAE